MFLVLQSVHFEESDVIAVAGGGEAATPICFDLRCWCSGATSTVREGHIEPLN